MSRCAFTIAMVVASCAICGPTHGAVGVHDPCPVPTPYPPEGAGWAAANNPGFEQGFSGGVALQWVAWKDPTYTGQVHFEGSDRFHAGSRSQKLSLPQPPPNTAHQETGVYQQIYVVPGGSYTVKAWFYLHFPIQSYNGEDLLASLGVDPFGEADGKPYGVVWSETATQGQWVQLSVSVQAILPVMTVTLKGTRKWPQHGDGALVYFDDVTITGPVPTEPPPGPEPDPVDSETLIPATTGPNLVANASFEDPYTSGVSANWNKWWTTGNGTWRRSQLMGKVGPGRYDCGPLEESWYMRPKTALLMGGNPEHNPNNTGTMGDAATLSNAHPEMADTIFVGRPFIDENLNSYFNTQTPAYWGARFADQCKHFESLVPRIDCWQGLNEPGTDDPVIWQKVLEWEHAFAERCHQLGLKSCSLNLATGNPGNIWRMIDERFSPSAHDVLDLADYLGHHVYGGPSDQFMVSNQVSNDACSFALRPRRFKDMYDRRDWRFPPVIATEGSTWGPWYGSFSEDQVANDLVLMGQYMNADRWWCGYTNFATGIQCNPAWINWDIVNKYTSGGRLISQVVGDWNEDHPADSMDGLYSQMFGAGNVHPVTSGQLTPAGMFTGGVNQQVNGLVAGEGYLVLCWMKYEFRGQQPDALEFHLGVDTTGQTANGNAGTIDWGANQIDDKAPVHEIFTHVWRTFTATGPSASVWLRARHPLNNPSFMCYVDLVEVRRLSDGPPVEIVRPDFDQDGDVDMDDHGHIQACLTGPGVTQNLPACLNARLDGDDDVDQDDVLAFENCLSGANNAPDPACDD